MQTTAPMRPAVTTASWVILGIGVVAASIAAILVRYANDAEPLAISFWRCALGAVALLPFGIRRLRAIPRRAAMVSGVAGVFLALHFATWITSLELTTIALSVLLVSTTPIFVALAAPWLLKERLPLQAWAGIGLAFLGTALITGLEVAGASIAGNALALAGAIAACGYVIGGSVARRDLDILQYAIVAYTVAAGVLLAASFVTDVDLVGYDAGTWWAIGAIVIGPQLLGHTLLNFVLAEIDPTTVTVAIMAEPVIASMLAALLFSEIPGLLVYPGGVAILVGIWLVSVARRAPAVIIE